MQIFPNMQSTNFTKTNDKYNFQTKKVKLNLCILFLLSYINFCVCMTNKLNSNKLHEKQDAKYIQQNETKIMPVCSISSFNNALKTLSDDHDSILGKMSELQTKIESLQNEIKIIQEKKIAEMQIEINKMLNQNYDLKILELIKKINQKNCYIANGMNTYGICPYGGEYRGGFSSIIEIHSGETIHLQFLGIKEQSMKVEGDAFLCCN